MIADFDWAARAEPMGLGVQRPNGALQQPTKITVSTSKPLSRSGLCLGWWTALPGQIEQVA